jgi:hypothetical protein
MPFRLLIYISELDFPNWKRLCRCGSSPSPAALIRHAEPDADAQVLAPDKTWDGLRRLHAHAKGNRQAATT